MTRFRSPQDITDLPDYILALIWFTASICGNSILISSMERKSHNGNETLVCSLLQS